MDLQSGERLMREYPPTSDSDGGNITGGSFGPAPKNATFAGAPDKVDYLLG